MKRLLKLTVVWLPSVPVPSLWPTSTFLASTALGSTLWSRMVATKKLFLWPKTGLPVWLTIKKSASKFPTYTSLGPKIMKATATIRKLSPVLPSWPSCSLRKLLLKLKLSAFTVTGSTSRRTATTSPELLSLVSTIIITILSTRPVWIILNAYTAAGFVMKKLWVPILKLSILSDNLGIVSPVWLKLTSMSSVSLSIGLTNWLKVANMKKPLKLLMN